MATLQERLTTAGHPAVEELRAVVTFSDLADDDLAWLSSHMFVLDYDDNDVPIRKGDPADT